MCSTCPTHIIEAANPRYKEVGTIVYLKGELEIHQMNDWPIYHHWCHYAEKTKNTMVKYCQGNNGNFETTEDNINCWKKN